MAPATGSSRAIGHSSIVPQSRVSPIRPLKRCVVRSSRRWANRVFGYLALALGIAFEIVGLVSLFIFPVLTPVVLGFQSLWIVATAVMLILGAGKASNSLNLSAGQV